MKIINIRILHYKSFLSEFIYQPKGLSIFIGKNNSGKSNIIDALYRFFRPIQHAERYQDTDARVEIEMLFTSKDRAYLSKEQQVKIPEHATISLVGDTLSLRTEDEFIPLPPPLAKFILQKSIRISAIRDLDYVKMKTLYEEFKSGWNKSFRMFTDTLQQFFPEIKTSTKLFSEKRGSFETSIKEFGKDRNIERLGLGFKHLFIVLLYFFHPRYDILCIDEPEIHLHPQMIKRIFEVFRHNIPNKQLFITTHSSLFVQPESLLQVIRVVREGSAGSSCHHLSNDFANKYRFEQELNADNGEMFFADHVLLVEGISDRIFIRELLDRFFPSPKDIKVIPVHGKENILVYIDILKGFKIPFSIMLDKDAYTDIALKKIIPKFSTELAYSKMKEIFRSHHVFILPHGSLEQHYPEPYSKDNGKTKPIRALETAQQISKDDLTNPRLTPIIEVIQDCLS